ncbi:Na(+)/H(+) exchange regulatory cofactor NHE-RF1 isoform X2 [Megalobrama amblycephala]|uniref:Na(+)/H(+) exchange regulatory cofactor NHE-RF1 isoform X2 n=1 Tax=Megalobrama amblycephala TaxID=75352 RepID=UPI002014114C|nr:Na(+)/H(+) exchange regulatory cofactor NHE-RF1 isoform X2 [Megalobrama amblycephala]
MTPVHPSFSLKCAGEEEVLEESLLHGLDLDVDVLPIKHSNTRTFSSYFISNKSLHFLRASGLTCFIREHLSAGLSVILHFYLFIRLSQQVTRVMPSQTLRPRLCVLEKGENGYGFHLHGEKGKTGQFIRLVEPDSPAELSGLRAGDRLVFVNGERVESDSHQQVVARIRASAGSLELIVVDADTDQLLKKHELKCVREFVTEGIPVPECDDEPEISDEMMRDDTPPPPPVPERNGEIIPVYIPAVEKLRTSVSSEMDLKPELRPRLCVIKKGSNGFGFNLHSEKSRPGQYIRAVDDDSPAQRSGLKPKDRIIQVNGLSVEGKQHAEVVAAIKAGGDDTTLLVVDPETDAFFKKCRVMPNAEHLTGPLPEPVVNGDMEDKVNGNVAKEMGLKDSKLSVSPSPSNASSNASLVTPPTGTPPPEAMEPSIIDAIPELNLSLQQVKERAHQKRSNKRAPPMDWNKKNELFSNL